MKIDIPDEMARDFFAKMLVTIQDDIDRLIKLKTGIQAALASDSPIKGNPKPEPNPPGTAPINRKRKYLPAVKDVVEVLEMAGTPLTPFKIVEVLDKWLNVKSTEPGIKQILKRGEERALFVHDKDSGTWSIPKLETE